MKKTILAASFAVLSLTQVNAFAEDDTMIVTATRTAQTADETLASVSVVTREDIDKYQYKTVAEALSGLAGVTIANSGGLGKQTSIFLRGTESNHTQILLNGAKLATNAFGAPQIEHIPLNQIDRIELVRGPQSSLYGSGSIGGTIQIFTKKGSGELTPNFSVGFGTHDTKETTFGVSGGDSSTWYSLGGGYTETNGFNSCDGRSGSLFIGCYTTEPDKDAYRNSNASVRVGHRFENSVEVEFFSLYSEGESEFDGFSSNQTDFLQHTFGTKVSTDITDKWSMIVSLSQGRIEADNNKDGLDFSVADNQQDHFSIQNDIQLSVGHLLTFGYDYEDDKIASKINSLQGYVDERHSNALFAQILGEYGKHNYQIALRAEEDEQFGGHTTGSIAWGTVLSDTLRFNMSFGTALTAPSLADLYYPATPYVFFGSFPSVNSDPNLKPEKSKSYEVGFTGKYSNINWSANLFQTDIKNLIDLDYSVFPVNGAPIPQNISKARIRGFGLEAATVVSETEVDIQFSWVSSKDKSGGVNDGNVLARRAEQTFTLNTFRSFGDFSLASKVFISGRSFDNNQYLFYGTPTVRGRLAGFTTVDLVGAYKISKGLTAQVKVANVFNEEYETVSGYNTDGTNIFFSINYQPAN